MRVFLGVLIGALPLVAWADEGHMAQDRGAMDHAMAGMAVDASPTVRASITAMGEVIPGKPVSLTLVLKDRYGRPLRPADVEIIHEQQVHLFLLDGSMSDYYHLHPVPGGADGEWVAGFTPQKPAYKAWVEVKPNDDTDQFVPMQLGGVIPQSTALGREDILTGKAGGMRFTLTLAMAPQAGMGTLAILNVYNEDGLPVTNLEPIMGAFAHMAGFDKNLETIIHVHPSGTEPEGPDSRGGPVLNFQLISKVSGMHRLFLQVKRKGEDVTVPFTLNVN